MRVLYCHDNIYQQCEDGKVYSPGQFPYSYWAPYLKTFDHLVVAGRGVGRKDEIHKLNISSGPDLSFTLFPNINTPKGRIKYYKSVDKRLKQIVSECDAVIIRAVSDIGWLAYKHAKQMNKPIAMEMAACGWDSTWNHGSKLGKIYAPIRYIRDRIITKHADFVIYVSQNFLQSRYPTNGQTECASNVRVDRPDLRKTDLRLKEIKKREEEIPLPYRLGLIGNLDNHIKGVADLLHALRKVQDQKPGCFMFYHLGPGNQEPYKELAEQLNLTNLVQFDGMIQSGTAVLDWLGEIDLYLQPSYQEGVPRATIEAMSMACPVIASHAGGIPELINEQWLIKPGDIDRLAELIIFMLESPKHQYVAAIENHARSLDYTSDVLQPKRLNFWTAFAEFAKSKANKEN